MNETGRNIINEINAVTNSTNGTYLSINKFKDCIKKHHPLVDVVFQSMIDKNLAYYSKDKRAVTLSEGLLDGFTPFTCSDVSECYKFAERMADHAINDYGKISNKDWILKYAFDSLLVRELEESTSKHWDVDKMALNKYHRIEEIIRISYWRESNKYAEECKKAIAKAEKEEAERISKITTNNNKLDALLKTGPYCVEFIEIEEEEFNPTLDEIDCYDEEDLITIIRKTKMKRFFKYLKDAEEFSRYLKNLEYSFTFDVENYNNYDWTAYRYSYEVNHCGATRKLSVGQVALIRKEDELLYNTDTVLWDV